MRLLLNEWVFHDLLSENGMSAFEKTRDFLRDLLRSQDILVFPDKERWKRKAFSLLGHPDLRVQLIGREFIGLLVDSDRTVRANREDMEMVEPDLYQGAPADDIYLVKAYHCAGAELLVTSDEGLFDFLELHPTVNCQMRNNFLDLYGP